MRTTFRWFRTHLRVRCRPWSGTVFPFIMALAGLCRRNVVYRVHSGFILVLLTSFWLMCHIMLNSNTFNKAAQRELAEENFNLTNSIILSMIPPAYHKYLVKNLSANGVEMNASSGKSQFTIDEIRQHIEEYNKMQTVLNEDIYGPLQNDSLVIVIQVHNRLMYLRHTIVSLAVADGIANALLVFSHDYFDEEINTLIRSIDFCKVIQIFYPYSIQTHPTIFPGESPNDCPRNINKKEAIDKNCTNALHPDLYGHYREAKFTQTKHHWWWKTNRVFDELNVTKNFTGLFVFFEEDHYVAPDFIHMLRLMETARQLHCQNCPILSLGSYLKTVDFAADSKKAEIKRWISSQHNMGMAFDRSVWKELKGCARTFCTFDDYNWDWSLLAVSTKCLPRELTTMVLRAPRVFHIGECGVHHKNSCKNMSTLRKVQTMLRDSPNYLFPQKLLLTRTSKKVMKKAKSNGGWGDVRDHNLCLQMVAAGS